MNNNENWDNNRFTELEVTLKTTVNAKGWRRFTSPWRLWSFVTGQIKQVKSLADAVSKSQASVILVEGEPGSGKSVALRHFALDLLSQAKKSRRHDFTIPLYFNLKELEREDGAPIDSRLIHQFVLRTLKRSKLPKATQFLDEEFVRGTKEGSWFFLFDSFDEIPDVLSSTENDQTVSKYIAAIRGFMSDMSKCRGIIASRPYHGPHQKAADLCNDRSCATARFVQLSLASQREIIHRHVLDRENEQILFAYIDRTHDMLKTPMYLSLLCEYVEENRALPTYEYMVYEFFIEKRLKLKKSVVERQYNLTAPQLRDIAEYVAFTMSATKSLGLTANTTQIANAMHKLALSVPPNLENALDALREAKLASLVPTGQATDAPSFTFIHRRIQEYLSTCLLRATPDRIPPTQMLTDGRWRESAVVLLQSGSPEIRQSLIVAAGTMLDKFIAASTNIITNPECYYRLTQPATDLYHRLLQLAYFSRSNWLQFLPHHARRLNNLIELLKKIGVGPLGFLNRRYAYTLKLNDHLDYFRRHDFLSTPFSWPPGALHVLSLLQDGFAYRRHLLPEDIQAKASALLLTAAERGTQIDSLAAMKVAATASMPTLTHMVRQALHGKSNLLQDTAYEQIIRLPSAPGDDLIFWIRTSLRELANSGQLKLKLPALRVFFKRLEWGTQLTLSLRLLRWLRLIDIALLFLVSFGIETFYLAQINETTYSLNISPELWYLTEPLFLTVFAWLLFAHLLTFRPWLFTLIRILPVSSFNRSVHTILIGLGHFLRLVALPLILRVIEDVSLLHDQGSLSQSATTSAILGLLALLYMLLWAPSAAFFVTHGNFVSWFWWPFYPILFPVHIIANFLKTLKRKFVITAGTPELFGMRELAEFSLNRNQLVMVIIASILLSFPAFSLFSLYTGTPTGSNSLFAPNQRANDIATIIFGVILLAFFTALPFQVFIRYPYLRWTKRKEWARLKERSIDFPTFLEMLRSYPWPLAADLVNYVRERSLLSPTAETLRSLHQFVQTVQWTRSRIAATQKYKVFVENTKQRLTNEHLLNHFLHYKSDDWRFLCRDQDLLDELVLLHQQIADQVDTSDQQAQSVPVVSD